MTPSDTGLPTNTDAEKFILGSILLDDSFYVDVIAALLPDDFSLEKHRRILRAMGDIHSRGQRIDRVVVAEELMKSNELESVGGLTALVDLDTGIPRIPHLDSYVRIVKEKSILRQIIFASQHMMNRCMSGDESPDEILSGSSETILKLGESGIKTTLMTPMEIVTAAGGLSSYLNRKTRITGLPSGYKSLDMMTGGFRKGALYILAARPAVGKTGLALNIVEKVSIDRGDTSLVFSLEMPGESLIDRLICARARVNSRKFDGGFLDHDEDHRITKAAGEIVGNKNLLIDEKAVTNIGEIHAKIRQRQAKGPVGLVVIDYLGLLVGGKAGDRTAETSLVSRGLKIIAKDCKVPMLVLAQLSRSCEQRGHSMDNYRPVLSDLRDSGGIEADADVVMFAFRPEIYFPDREDLRGVADLIVAKQRQGPTGTVPLVWLKEYVRFEERAKEHSKQPRG